MLMTLDAEGQLWVGTLEGLVRVNTSSALIMKRIEDLPGATVQALAISPEGLIWAGMPNNC